MKNELIVNLVVWTTHIQFGVFYLSQFTNCTLITIKSLTSQSLNKKGEAAYANAVARKTRLEEEAALVADLEASMAASDLQALSRHVATCLRLGIANKHPGVMIKAKAKAAELGAQQQVRRRKASFLALIVRGCLLTLCRCCNTALSSKYSSSRSMNNNQPINAPLVS